MIRIARVPCLILLCIASMCVSCGHRDAKPPTKSASRPSQQLRNLTVGIQVSPAMTLVMVAKDQGLFERAGVEVTLMEFTAGKFALQAFLGGSLDVAVSGEVPVALSMLQGNKFRVLTQVVERTTNECRVVVRKEEGLDTPEKYFGAKKRRLATSFGGGPEFFTYNFLRRHLITNEQAELISQKPEDMPAALASGTVDAISVFDPQARIAERILAENALTFADPDIYSELYVVSVMQTTIDQRPDDLRAFLRALHEAEFYIQQHPEESKHILVRYTKLDKEVVDDIWGNFVFRPVINRLFTDLTTAEAHWAIEKGTFPAGTALPDFRAVLHPDLLRSVDSGLVNVDWLPRRSSAPSQAGGTAPGDHQRPKAGNP